MKIFDSRSHTKRPLAKIETIVLPLVAGAVLLFGWSLAVRMTHTRIFPSPLDVARAIRQLGETRLLWTYAADSIFRALTGYLLAAFLGVPLGILLGRSRSLTSAVNPVIQMLRPISPLAWMPLAIIWFGIGNAAPIFLIFLASLFPIVISAMNAVLSVPLVFIQAGRNHGLNNAQLMRRVIFPAVLPRIVVGLRIAFGVAWLVLVAAEMIAVDSGLGYLIIDARNAGKRYDLVVAGMLLIGVIGLVLDIALRGLERLPGVRWGFSE